MGYLRYFLALMVLINHLGVDVLTYRIGATAVIPFFIISGFVIRKIYESNPQPWKVFLIARLIRIMPQFILYSIVTLALLEYTKLGSMSALWMNFSTCTWGLLALSFTVIGNNFNIFGDCILVPPAWSLGLELVFYISVLFIFKITLIKRQIIFILSFIVFLIAASGIIYFPTYAYRHIVGTLFIFMLGCCIIDKRFLYRYTSILVYFLVFLLLIFVYLVIGINNYDTKVPLGKEVLLGIIFGMPIVALLKNTNQTKIDKIFRNISYGVFLNHILIARIYLAYVDENIYRPTAVLVIVFFSTLLAYITYLFWEKPIIKFLKRYVQN